MLFFWQFPDEAQTVWLKHVATHKLRQRCEDSIYLFISYRLNAWDTRDPLNPGSSYD